MNITYSPKSITALFLCSFLLACGMHPNNAEKAKMVEVILQNAQQGDMIVAYSERLTTGIILLIEQNDTASKRITGIEPFGFGKNNTRPYSDIIAIVLEGGNSVSVIPKRDVITAIRSMTEVAKDFKY